MQSWISAVKRGSRGSHSRTQIQFLSDFHRELRKATSCSHISLLSGCTLSPLKGAEGNGHSPSNPLLWSQLCQIQSTQQKWEHRHRTELVLRFHAGIWGHLIAIFFGIPKLFPQEGRECVQLCLLQVCPNLYLFGTIYSYNSEITEAWIGDIFYFPFYGKPFEFKQERSVVRSGHSLQHPWRG